MSRPVLPWRSPLVLVPASPAPVWLRRLPFYDTPVRATSDPDNAAFAIPIFKTDGDNETSISIPYQDVHTWKFQFLPDEQAYQSARQPDWPH